MSYGLMQKMRGQTENYPHNFTWTAHDFVFEWSYTYHWLSSLYIGLKRQKYNTANINK